jgi:hypothetical protein
MANHCAVSFVGRLNKGKACISVALLGMMIVSPVESGLRYLWQFNESNRNILNNDPVYRVSRYLETRKVPLDTLFSADTPVLYYLTDIEPPIPTVLPANYYKPHLLSAFYGGPYDYHSIADAVIRQLPGFIVVRDINGPIYKQLEPMLGSNYTMTDIAGYRVYERIAGD